MAKFFVLSDIHIDQYLSETSYENMVANFEKYLAPIEDISERTLICAGDISGTFEGWTKCDFLFDKFKHVILTLGNHDMVKIMESDAKTILEYNYNEFFGCEPTTENKIKLIKTYIRDHYPNVTILDGNVVDYEGVKIGGTFGWYDWLDGESPLDELDWKNWYDGYWNYFNQSLRTIAYNEVKKMKSVLDEKPDIFITHVAHSYCNTNPMYRCSNSNKFFYYSPNEYDMSCCKYVICGHTHDSVIDKGGFNTIMCNPKGYYDEIDPLKLNNLNVKDFLFEI